MTRRRSVHKPADNMDWIVRAKGQTSECIHFTTLRQFAFVRKERNTEMNDAEGGGGRRESGGKGWGVGPTEGEGADGRRGSFCKGGALI